MHAMHALQRVHRPLMAARRPQCMPPARIPARSTIGRRCGSVFAAASAAAAAAGGGAPSTQQLQRQQQHNGAAHGDGAAPAAQLEAPLPPKADARVTVFSAAQYVTSFLQQPLEQAGFDKVHFVEARLDAETAALAQGSLVVCLFVNDVCDTEVVQQLQACGVKLIAMRCAGFDRVDVAACHAAGIQVVRVPTYSPTSVAEHAVALCFALNRHLHQAHVRVMAGNYSLTPLVGMELRNKKVAVVGTGAIGTEAVRLFRAIGMEVFAGDVRQNPKVIEMGVPYLDLDEMLPEVHVVSLHVPLLPSTRHILNQERINKLRQGCLVLNVSRGGLVDNKALINGLEQGSIGGLGMDVYENEGSLFFTDWTDMDLNTRMKNWDRCFKMLTAYPQVLITPHSAFLTVEALANIAATTISNMEEFLAGQPLTNAIKPPQN